MDLVLGVERVVGEMGNEPTDDGREIQTRVDSEGGLRKRLLGSVSTYVGEIQRRQSEGTS